MLHIILLILKIIGIILLVLIGLVLLVSAVILLAPFQYQGMGSCKGTLNTLKAEVKVSWIFHLVSGKAILDQGKIKWQFRAAWLKWSDESDTGIGRKKENHKVETSEMPEDDPEKESDRVLEEKYPEAQSSVTPQKLLEDENTVKKLPEKETKAEQKKDKTTKKEEQKTQGFLRRIWERIKNIWQKMKYTFIKLYARIKVFIRRKTIVMDFLADEVHKSAFARAKKELKRTLKRLKPKRFKMRLRFGFEDPSLTGKVLAVLCMVYPFINGHAQITPEFEQCILEGDVFIKGHIRVMYFIAAVISIILDKNIRKTYKDFRKMKM